MGFEAFKPAPPVSMPEVSPSSPLEPGNASTEAPQEEQYYTSVTPSGIEVAYSPAPRRHYRLRQTEVRDGNRRLGRESEWIECPSVTNVLSVLEKPALVWWGQGVGVEGLLKLVERGAVNYGRGILGGTALTVTGGSAATKEEVVALLTEHKLTVNHVKDKAADRGVNVHGALEAWWEKGPPNPDAWPDNERGYVEGLSEFMRSVEPGVDEKPEFELMVGSLEHAYAGRFDLVLTLSKPVEVVTKTYPKRKPKVEEIPAGRYLLDLKTSKGIYNTHYLQLEAYEAAAVECGYEPTDHRGVIHVTADGRYELALNKDWTFEDFLSVRACFQTMNERSVVQALRDELDATEVK